jgi:hypothetical protein
MFRQFLIYVMSAALVMGTMPCSSAVGPWAAHATGTPCSTASRHSNSPSAFPDPPGGYA